MRIPSFTVVNCLKKALFCTNVFILTTFFWVFIYRYVNPPMPHSRVAAENVQSKFRWVDYNDISINLKRAVVVAEDKSFLYHHGFDFNAIKLAYKINLSDSKTQIGASTITQQTAKNVFLWNGRTWIRKVFEAYFTFLIELCWDKKRILEVYLNVVEYGDHIYGIDAASKLFFNINPIQLNENQAALIAVILPNPKEWSPIHPNEYVTRKSKNIQGRTHRFSALLEGL
ncbi:monofunctional biosynthetic peptidoglycan transglycosylase [Pedobacter punctiformis]|uniref:Biosynthetic peptidoglycan transglycosylase n=1 Tax=Pedobacter punctiformis TaxID=3004097 RepID=A0ABT4L5W3_9SPHI|nr:monofunctional biosynthetic peptidoglycan transglycosylase [Pedobacter sp. HCMS5-2]MCZ4243315.1 monofunctional biosynthetic peptidoglycan transglycosylase [Pedobacter sp. HCMS5-2]